MILKTLQLIATAMVPHHHKTRWLSFWNSGTRSCEAFHFLAKEFKTDDLESWLKKASFWAGIRYYCPSLIYLAYSFTRYYCPLHHDRLSNYVLLASCHLICTLGL